jgi:hypothetical protein
VDGTPGLGGSTGATGPTGPAGASGASGADGAPGKDGTNGADGKTGPRGLRGFTARMMSLKANGASQRVLRIRVTRGSKAATGKTVTITVHGRRYKGKTSSRGIARVVLPATGKVVLLNVK